MNQCFFFFRIKKRRPFDAKKIDAMAIVVLRKIFVNDRIIL